MTPREKNAAIRELRSISKDRDRGDRIAVFAVAAGERLGATDEELLNLRYAAELHDVAPDRLDESPYLGEAADLLRKQGSPVLLEILGAAQILDELLQSGNDTAAELRRQPFDSEVIEALLAVQRLIQPVGT